MTETRPAPSHWSKTWRVGSVLRGVRPRLGLPGFLVGTLLFALSLTPSLLPRTSLVQGILSGCAFAIGYGIGVTLQWLWDYMELKLPQGRWNDRFKLTLALACVAFAVFCLYQTSAWQDGVRRVMGTAPVESGHPLQVLLVALLPAAGLILLGTMLVHGVRFVSRQLMRIVPRRVAFVASLVIVGIVTTTLFNGVLLRSALRAADGFFERLDSVAGQFGDPPTDPLSTGSAASLVAWHTIGRDGRIYVQTGPSSEQIATVLGRPARQPLRVYVGLRSAPSIQERAQLALAEMLRVGAF
ncbi:MAG TPA: alpha/beta-hydrolase N-terminal domain-containing protein, partial [Devosia sp.]|nr:alpha/beta-hydrolase N-terminal domain-containing protein [Devosia sp.]